MAKDKFTKAKIPTTQWIITKLHSYIGELISFQCKHRYVGTIVYHKIYDLLKALSIRKKMCGKEKRKLSMNNDHGASPSQRMKF